MKKRGEGGTPGKEISDVDVRGSANGRRMRRVAALSPVFSLDCAYFPSPRGCAASSFQASSVQPPESVVAVAAGEFADDVAYEVFGVAEEHQGLIQVVQRVVDAGEAGGHAALDDHDGAGFVDVQDGHAEDGAAGIGARGGIGDVVGADDQRDVGLRHVAVDGVHVQQLVVGDVGFGEQHVHVPGHATGDGVNAEGDVHAALGERVEQLAHFVLPFPPAHAVAGTHHPFLD